MWLLPLPKLTATIEQLGPQNLGQRMLLEQTDGEVRELATAVNRMLDRVAIGFEGQRRFAANASHELPGTVPVRLDELVDSVLAKYTERLTEHGLALRAESVELTVPGDPILLERLIVNLVHNAIKYNRPGGVIEVIVGQEPALSVRNSGEHVPAEGVDTLFQPFRRLTADRMNHRDGVGLGLSIVRSIAAAHHGRVTAVPGEDGGLRVDVVLPVSDDRVRGTSSARGS